MAFLIVGVPMGRKNLHRIPIQVTLDPDIYEWITQEAKKHRTSVSQVMRELASEKMQTLGIVKEKE